MSTTFTLTSNLRVTPKWVDAQDMIDVIDTATPYLTLDLAQGTGTGQANAYWKGVITISAGNTSTIDLRNLPLDVFGGSGSLLLASVKMLLVTNSSAVSVTMGGDASNPWTGRLSGTEVIGPSGVVYAVNGTGWATTTSSKVLAFSAASAATLNVYIAGVQA